MSYEPKYIQLQGKTVFSKAIVSGFRRVPKYFVADESCFLWLRKGEFSLRTPDKLLEFRQDDGLLAKCGNYFIESQSHKADGQVEIVAAYFHPSIVKPFFPGDLSFCSFKPDFDASKVPVADLLRIFMESIDFMLENPLVVTDDLVVLKLKELLLLLARTDQAPSVHHFVASLFKPYEYDFRETVQKNALSNLSLAELATLCNMSLATFKRRFSEVFEATPAQFLMNEKLKKAAEMLALPETQVSNVVFECGFESASHFSKAFRKRFGLSPTAFQRNGKPANP